MLWGLALRFRGLGFRDSGFLVLWGSRVVAL